MKKRTIGRFHRPAIGAGLATLAVLLGLITLYQLQQDRQEKLQMKYIAQTIEAETYETLVNQFDKSRVLEGYLIETGGTFDSFGPIAQVLLEDNEAIQNVLFAPGGIVASAFPAEGNIDTLGLDLNSSGQGNWEAQEAIRMDELFMAGPFELVEGGMGICGRLPVYLENEAGEQTYWGLVSVTLRYPDIFAEHPIYQVNEQGFACRVWRINPDDGQKQVILETAEPIPADTKVLRYELQMFNANWVAELAALVPWYRRPMLWILILCSVGAGALVTFGVESDQEIRRMRAAEAEQQIRHLRQELELEQTNSLIHQISTHFFYHTLNALQALIVLKPDAAYKMAGDFSRYLRFNVDAITASGGIVTFKQELRAVRAYADINREQLGDRLEVVFDVPDVDFRMPALTLQPIVENAIIHGIKPKVGGGTVSVDLAEDVDHWYITVRDDGQGFDLAEAEKNQSVGLLNVRKRIEKFQGCDLWISSTPGAGTTVVLIYRKVLKAKG